MLPTLTQMQYFRVTAETGQVTKAAAISNVTQSSITIAINSLEEILGYKLFKRTSRGMVLTSEGVIYLRHVTGIMHAMQESLNLVTEKNDSLTGTIRLAVTDTISGYYLPKIWSSFQTRYPNMKLIPFETNHDGIQTGLMNREYDLAIVLTSNISRKEDFKKKQLLNSQRRLWVSSSHRLAQVNKKLSFNDIEGEPFILLSIDDHERIVQGIWDRNSYNANVIFRTNSFEALRSMVAHGLGVALVSDLFFRSWSIDGGRLVSKQMEDKLLPVETGIIWPRTVKLNDACQTFIDHLSNRH